MDEVERLLLKADADLNELNLFAAQHKAGFRVAFEFLRDCFPPQRDEGYWKATANLFQKRIDENPNVRILAHLMPAMMDYLGELTKDLPEEDENT